ncbi:autotransporter domain protein [Campylobacter pinnipediorum subsp. pinnipediorum]|uniref:autotransporter outer membrane beta-barrel domain-containing protein n=1 Tax=Campylobacter pinnipediorum TaxID=1965231 RepID=UPI0009951FC3|nr:autotransporter outer membrane beta-barrel domain-containing protein [Campylobacter pinnipediorum]AQW85085.1 autotransporter domain protein [Campylobacter pinnipediorum subsp. pinnipediorum]
MKISKIASATLIVVALTQGICADDKKEEIIHSYKEEKSNLQKSQEAEKEITSALQELKQYVDYLKDYDPKKNTQGTSKNIGELIQRIDKVRQKLNHVGDNVLYPDSNGELQDYIEYKDKDNNSVKLAKNGTKVEIIIKDVEKGRPKDFALSANPTKNDFETFFKNTKRETIIGLMDGFIKAFHKAVEIRADRFVKQKMGYISEINENSTIDFLSEDTQIIKEISKDIKDAAEALGTNHKLTIGNNSAGQEVEITIKNAEHAKELADAVKTLETLETLNNSFSSLEHAKSVAKVLIDAGLKLKSGKNLSDISSVQKLKDAFDLNTKNTYEDITEKFLDDKTVKDAVIAFIMRDGLFEFNQNDKMISVIYAEREKQKEQLKKALETHKGFKQEIEKNNKLDSKIITLKSTPKELVAQKRALYEITKVLNSTAKDYDATNKQDQQQDEAKKAFDEALAKAKEAGVVVAGEEEKKANDLQVKVDNALKVFNNNNIGIRNIVIYEENFESAEQAYNDSLDLRKDAFTKDPKTPLSSMGKDVISIIFDIVNSNDTAEKALILDKNSLVSFVKSNEDSIKEASSEIGKVSNLDMVNFSSQLSTQTRLAKLSNPFNEDLALASAINKLSNDKFADNGDSVSSIIKSYTDRFNNDNNIWANVIGAKGKVKDSSNPELHGFSIGYDRAFDNTIVGGYMTLAKSKSDSSLINTKASNYQFGLYARTYMDNSEIDTRVSFGKAKNKIDRYVKSNGDVLTQNGKYDTTYASLAVDYGYVMNLSDSLFMKPLVGLDYSHSKSKAFKESGDLPLSFNGVTSKSLNAKLGLEFRKYVDDGNYLYITPGFEAEVYKDVKDPVARFVGSSKDIKLKADDKKGRFATLKTGAELKLTDSLSTNINFGVKAKSKQQYFDGTVGLKYKF